MFKKKKDLIKISFLITFIVMTAFYYQIYTINKSNIESNEFKVFSTQKTSYFNNSHDPIFINGTATGFKAHNWSWAVSQDWCINKSGKYYIENLTINGQSLNNCLEIHNSNVPLVIKNCTFYNSSRDPEISPTTSGIYLSNSNNTQIINNTIYSCNGNGIYTIYSNYNNISGNFINDNYFSGIDVVFSYNNTIVGNNLKNNDIGIISGTNTNLTISENKIINCTEAIMFHGYNCTISKNNITNSGITFPGGIPSQFSSNKIDTSNLINGKPLYFYVNEKGLKNSNFTNPGQIILLNCNNTMISGINISNTSNGYLLWDCTNTTLININSSNNFVGGVWINSCDNSSIINSTINNNMIHGIVLGGGSNHTIKGNKLYNNKIHGISPYGTNISILDNTMKGCGIAFPYPNSFINNIFNVDNNTVNDKSIFFYKNKVGLCNDNFSNPGQIILVNCNDSYISNLNISDTSMGLYLQECKNTTLFNITSYNSGYVGLLLEQSLNNTIINSTIRNTYDVSNFYTIASGNGNGILLRDSINNSIISNNLTHNSHGITLIKSDENRLKYNNIENNCQNGLNVKGCFKNEIFKNTINYNHKIGISCGKHEYFFNDCTFNNISENTIIGNGILGIDVAHSDNNTLSWNTLKFNFQYGIKLIQSDYNNVSWNVLIDNGDCISEVSCVGNILKNNTCGNSPQSFTLFSIDSPVDIDGTFILNWTISSGANNYSLYNSTNYIMEVNDSITLIEEGLDDLNYTLSGLMEGGYYYIVIAFNEYGNRTSNCLSIIVDLPNNGQQTNGGIPSFNIFLIISMICVSSIILAKKLNISKK